MTLACGFPLPHALESLPGGPGFRAGSDALETWLGPFRFAPPVLFLFAWARLAFASCVHTQRKLLSLQNLIAVEAHDARRRSGKIGAVTADSFERAMDIVLGADLVIYPENETFEPEETQAAVAGKA